MSYQSGLAFQLSEPQMLVLSLPPLMLRLLARTAMCHGTWNTTLLDKHLHFVAVLS
jgi:hypothetical protein